MQRHFPRARSNASPGANLTFIVIMLFVCIAFLGMGIVSGMTTLLQDELTKATSLAAMVGASEFFSGDTAGPPVEDAGNAQTAATVTFNRALASSSGLQNFNATLQGVATDAGSDTVTVRARMLIPMPILALMGIDQLQIDSEATSRYVLQEPPGFPVQLYSPAPPGTAGGLPEVTNAGDPTCGALPAAAAAATANFAIPVTDRKGPDIRIESNDGHGYMVYACNANNCWDISGAARMEPGGLSRPMDYGTGNDTRILYGTANIDLGSTSPDYGGGIRKATSVRIVDDGIPDVVVGGNRAIEVCPQPLTIDRVAAYHAATTCVRGSANCGIPNGFAPM